MVGKGLFKLPHVKLKLTCTQCKTDPDEVGRNVFGKPEFEEPRTED
jgi:hypothetical protein